MNKKTLLLSLLLLLFQQVLLAQAPPIEWIKCYGGNYVDFEPTIEAPSGGGYIITGGVDGPGGDGSGHPCNIDLGDHCGVQNDPPGAIPRGRCLGGPIFYPSLQGPLKP